MHNDHIEGCRSSRGNNRPVSLREPGNQGNNRVATTTDGRRRRVPICMHACPMDLSIGRDVSMNTHTRREIREDTHFSSADEPVLLFSGQEHLRRRSEQFNLSIEEVEENDCSTNHFGLAIQLSLKHLILQENLQCSNDSSDDSIEGLEVGWPKILFNSSF